MIIRHNVGEYEGTKTKKVNPVKRAPEDFDLGWNSPNIDGSTKVYILDEHEWFDPHTSSKYHGEVSRHAMYGPAFIVVTDYCGGMNTQEYHVNDPSMWAWLRRCISQGYLCPDSMMESVNDEKLIVVQQ
jgi:hypothetical protein